MNDVYDIIKQKANGHEDIVPPDAWDNIKRKNNKRYIGFFLWLAGILLVVLIKAGYFNPKEFSRNETIQHADKPVNVVTPTKEVLANSKSSFTIETKETERKKALASPDKANEPVINKISANDNSYLQSSHDVTFSPSARITANEVQKGLRKIKTDTDPIFDKTNALISRRSKSLNKQRARSKISITAAESEGLAESVNMNQDGQRLTSDDKIASTTTAADLVTIGNENIIRQEKSDSVKNEPAVNDLPADMVLKKTIVTVPAEMKKDTVIVKKAAGKKPWFIDLTISPVFAFQQYDHSVSFNRILLLNADKSAFKGNIGRSYIPPSLAFSVGLRKAINKKISIKLGVQYLQLNEKIRVAGLQTYTQVNISDNQINYNDDGVLVADTNTVVLETRRDFNAVNRYIFLSVPVAFQYNIFQMPSWSLGVEAGVNVNIISRYKNHINRNPDAPLVNISQSAALKTKVAYTIFAGVRLGTLLTKRMELFATPSLSYCPVQQYIKNTLVNKKIHLAGIGFGISYQIR